MSDQVTARRFEESPRGVWTAEKTPAYGDEYREVRQVLRIALQLGRWRAFAGGVWWRFQPR